MVYDGGYPHKKFKLDRWNYKNRRKIRQNFVKRKKWSRIFLPPPSSSHHKNGFDPPTIKISKTTPHRPSGPLPISRWMDGWMCTSAQGWSRQSGMQINPWRVDDAWNYVASPHIRVCVCVWVRFVPKRSIRKLQLCVSRKKEAKLCSRSEIIMPLPIANLLICIRHDDAWGETEAVILMPKTNFA